MLISEHLARLDPETSRKALANFEAQGRENETTVSPAAALKYAFTWDTTPEGGHYWREVFNKLREPHEDDQL